MSGVTGYWSREATAQRIDALKKDLDKDTISFAPRHPEGPEAEAVRKADADASAAEKTVSGYKMDKLGLTADKFGDDVMYYGNAAQKKFFEGAAVVGQGAGWLSETPPVRVTLSVLSDALMALAGSMRSKEVVDGDKASPTWAEKANRMVKAQGDDMITWENRGNVASKARDDKALAVGEGIVDATRLRGIANNEEVVYENKNGASARGSLLGAIWGGIKDTAKYVGHGMAFLGNKTLLGAMSTPSTIKSLFGGGKETSPTQPVPNWNDSADGHLA